MGTDLPEYYSGFMLIELQFHQHPTDLKPKLNSESNLVNGKQ